MSRAVRYLLLVTLVAMLYPFAVSAEDTTDNAVPYNRHFIILVDQTISADNPNFKNIYQNLTNWFVGNSVGAGLDRNSLVIPDECKFDPAHDAISLYGFAISGLNSANGDIRRIMSKGALATSDAQFSEICDDITRSLFHPRARYLHGESVYGSTTIPKTLSEFLSQNLSALFNGTDPTYKEFHRSSGVTLSFFVYPLILNYLNPNEVASEYYIITVSDFKTGVDGNNDSADWSRISEISSKGVENYLKGRLKDLKAPFLTSDYLKFQSGENGGANTVIAKGMRLMLKSTAQKEQVFLSNNVSVKQTSGTKFSVGPGRIGFVKDAQTEMQRIEIVVSDECGELARVEAEDCDYDDSRKEYTIPAQKIDLGTTSFDGDLLVQYVIYTMSKDSKGKDLLAVSLVATQQMDKDNVQLINKQLRKTMVYGISILIILGVLLTLMYLGRKKRLKVNVGQFSQRYVQVDAHKGAVELPCWFQQTPSDHQQAINVKGSVSKAVAFGYGGGVTLSVRLQDAKPDGFTYAVNGKTAADWVTVPLHGGKFSFNLDIDSGRVGANQLQTCGVKIDFKITSSILGVFPKEQTFTDMADVEFYFMQHLGNAWVGFDPGTTGSCVAYGCTGGALDDPNIRMVVDSDNHVVIPSKLSLQYSIGSKSVESAIPGKDYKYGSEADLNWIAEIRAKAPVFQSIKKLLGYKNTQGDKNKVTLKNGGLNPDIDCEYSGVDLAYLLVKGLKKELDNSVSSLSATDKERYTGKAGCARRAVVAIPNNYTLPKTLDMVNSIRRLNAFDEVRYIYEAEGVLFNYFRKNYKNQKPGSEVIMVYDMGGATINLSIFRVNYVSKHSTIYYNVQTLGRIGYGVGGDNIDVALMEHLLSNYSGRHNADQRHNYEKSHKSALLKAILTLKKNIVAAHKGDREGNNLVTANAYSNFLNKEILGTYSSVTEEEVENNIGGASEFIDAKANELVHAKELDKFVYDCITDAVSEILNYPAIRTLSKVDTVIFAGRSTMFPRVQQTVLSTLKKRFKGYKVYEGFSDIEIKTSVSYGACWYGIYNNLVTLDNSRLASAFGFKISEGGKTRLEVLLNQNDRFDETSNRVAATKVIHSPFPADGNVVDFFQVMGSGVGEQIFSESNRHKVNYIGTIDAVTTTESISMSVDRQNVVTCQVKFETGTISRINDLNVTGRDITKENDWPYIFAALPSQDETIVTQESTNTRAGRSHLTGRSQTAKTAAEMAQEGQTSANGNINHAKTSRL